MNAQTQGYYAADRKRADIADQKAKLHLCKIFGVDQSALRDASFIEDTKQVTDLIITREGVEHRVSLRMRDNYYYASYPHDITLRIKELPKILAGQGEYLFYYFYNKAGDITAYTFVYFDRCREELKAFHTEDNKKWNKSDNTYFHPVDTTKLPPDSVVHRKIK